MKRDLIYLCVIALLFVWAYTMKPKQETNERVEYIERVEEVFVVTATVYHAVEEQCDSDCLVTASGAKISSADTAYEHRYLAVSRDLLELFPYGTKVEISGCGELDGIWVVEDTMNRRYKGYIDLLINPDMKVGKWEGVKMRKYGNND